MFRRALPPSVFAFSSCVLVLVSACAEVPSKDGAAGDGLFTVESPSAVVAADGQAWLLINEGAGQSLSRLELTGPLIPVMDVPGQSVQLAPYRGGVIIASVACSDEGCQETVVNGLVVDGEGLIVSEQELLREPFGPEDSDSVRLIGVYEDIVWVNTNSEVIGYNPQTGQTVARATAQPGATCLLADGQVYALLSLGEPLGGRGVYTGETLDDPYDVGIHRLVDGRWTLLPETRRTLTELQLGVTRCVGGAMRSGPDGSTSPTWSPSSGWTDGLPLPGLETDEGPVEGPPGLSAPILPQADGRENQRFILESDGVIRRVFGSRDVPLTVDTVNVPADIFKHDSNSLPSRLVFDMSSTVVVGCIEHSSEEIPTGQCYIGTP